MEEKLMKEENKASSRVAYNRPTTNLGVQFGKVGDKISRITSEVKAKGKKILIGALVAGTLGLGIFANVQTGKLNDERLKNKELEESYSEMASDMQAMVEHANKFAERTYRLQDEHKELLEKYLQLLGIPLDVAIEVCSETLEDVEFSLEYQRYQELNEREKSRPKDIWELGKKIAEDNKLDK